jgi:hypothetical protein
LKKTKIVSIKTRSKEAKQKQKPKKKKEKKDKKEKKKKKKRVGKTSWRGVYKFKIYNKKKKTLFENFTER